MTVQTPKAVAVQRAADGRGVAELRQGCEHSFQTVVYNTTHVYYILQSFLSVYASRATVSPCKHLRFDYTHSHMTELRRRRSS